MGTEVIAWIPQLPAVAGGEPAAGGACHAVAAEGLAASRVPDAAAGGGTVAAAVAAVDTRRADAGREAGRSVGRDSGGRAATGLADAIAAASPVVPATPPSPTPAPYPASAGPAESARAQARVPFSAPRFPAGSIVVLALMSAVVWGMAWRNELRRLDAQRRGPERLAREPSAGPDATRSIRP